MAAKLLTDRWHILRDYSGQRDDACTVKGGVRGRVTEREGNTEIEREGEKTSICCNSQD